MGRTAKTGLSYFPVDVDFFDDEKMLFVSARFGVIGEAIAIRLLCRIYRNGYYMPFDDDTALLFARSLGDISLHKLVVDVVDELLKRGFFNSDMQKKFGILTSTGIQKRYEKICTDARRVGWEIAHEYDLLRQKTLFTPEEKPLTTADSTQRKEEESIEEYEQRLAEQKRFKEFQKWILSDAPRVAQMKEPFSFQQWKQATEEFGKFGDTLKDMHNYEPLLKKNRSAYLTMRNWRKRNFNNKS